MGWLVVLFDLPTDTKEERKAATKFRNDLLDQGYLMFQYSVYVRSAVTLDKKAHFISELKRINPDTGNVRCLFITDNQWGQIVTICAKETMSKRDVAKQKEIGEQLQFW